MIPLMPNVNHQSVFVGKSIGTSMEPLINQGDKLYVEKLRISQLKIGDIIVFYSNNNFIGHRIIRINKKRIITKGDNSIFWISL